MTTSLIILALVAIFLFVHEPYRKVEKFLMELNDKDATYEHYGFVFHMLDRKIIKQSAILSLTGIVITTQVILLPGLLMKVFGYSIPIYCIGLIIALFYADLMLATLGSLVSWVDKNDRENSKPVGFWTRTISKTLIMLPTLATTMMLVIL